jgi:hypothetical protein
MSYEFSEPIKLLVIFFKIHIFLLGYICYIGGFIVSVLVRLTLYLSYIAPIISLNHLPTTLKAIARGFFVLFHIGI